MNEDAEEGCVFVLVGWRSRGVRPSASGRLLFLLYFNLIFTFHFVEHGYPPHPSILSSVTLNMLHPSSRILPHYPCINI
ncbi:hypothetical protein L208DRAFT_947144 [Tricholoma matsutake]|nr:hypothetical protein L208DRAFT_947144 [Tricholoma matsutake 945]